MNIREASHELWKIYIGNYPRDLNVGGIGIDETNNIIHIYVVKRISGYPDSYEGFPIKITKTGKITLN